MEEPLLSPQPSSYRLHLLQAALAFAFLILGGQLVRLQIFESDRYRAYAEENRVRVRPVLPQRGIVYDRNGTPLVRNIPTFTLAIIPAGIPRGGEDTVFQRLSQILALPVPEMEQLYQERKGSAFSPVPIATNLPLDLATIVEERHQELPGVAILVEPVREYLTGPLTAHLLGYVGRITKEQYLEQRDDARLSYQLNDRIGQTGLELTYEAQLRGIPGEDILEVDSTERPVNTLKSITPQPGANLVLTIDLKLQQLITDILARQIDRFGSAVAIAMDPRNGQILAIVDLPTYDNNVFQQGIAESELSRLMDDPRFPLVNRAIGGAWAPGSAFKIVTAAAALQEGVVTPNTLINDPGGIWVPNEYIKGQGQWFKNWAAHGIVDMVAALAVSCDTYFYLLAGGDPNGKWDGLGNKRLARYARLFGMGAPTGVDLPGEIAGIVPDEDWKKATIGEPWVKGETYTYGIGQSYLAVTPLQLLNATAAIANGGKLYRPQVVLEVRDQEGNTIRPFQPQLIREVPIDQRFLEVIRKGLRADMEVSGVTPNGARYTGTAWTAEVPGLDIAGKTGTAEFGTPDRQGNYPTHGWFTAYRPSTNAEFALVVFVERGGGPQDAAEVAEEIFRAYYDVPATGASRRQ